jgi:hypothetical protein
VAEATTRAAGPGQAARPAPVLGRHRSTAPPLARSRRLTQLWPLGALLVVGLLGARTLRGTPLPGDGALAVPAYDLLPGGTGDGPLSPSGLAATHTAAYVAVTRAFSRHATLTGAEREVLLVALLLAVLLGWRTARRLGVSDTGCAVGLLGLGGVLVVFPFAAVAAPAALAVPWAASAGYLSTLRRSPLVSFGLAALSLVPAVLLAPDVLLAVVAGVGTAVAVWSWSAGGRLRGAGIGVATVLALVAVRLGLAGWDPEDTDPARWDGSTAGLVVLGVVLLVIAVATALLVPALRPAAAGLLALTALAVVPPSGRVSALLLALPLGALLLAALAGRATVPRRRPARATPASARRPALLAAAAVLTVLVVLAGTALARAPRDDFGAARDRALLGWAGAQLPAGATLDVDPPLAAELRQAGAPAGLLDDEARADRPAGAPVLQVTPGEPETAVVARFTDDDGRTLTVVDPGSAAPDADQLGRRRTLGAALLANPRTQLPDTAAGRLQDGAVDPRLLTLLAGIVARFDVRLADLPPAPGEEGPSAVRSALLTAADGTPLAADAPAQAALETWLSAQRAPLAPDDVRPTDDGLLIGFRYVTDPDGVVSGTGG